MKGYTWGQTLTVLEKNGIACLMKYCSHPPTLCNLLSSISNMIWGIFPCSYFFHLKHTIWIFSVYLLGNSFRAADIHSFFTQAWDFSHLTHSYHSLSRPTLWLVILLWVCVHLNLCHVVLSFIFLYRMILVILFSRFYVCFSYRMASLPCCWQPNTVMQKYAALCLTLVLKSTLLTTVAGIQNKKTTKKDPNKVDTQ